MTPEREAQMRDAFEKEMRGYLEKLIGPHCMALSTRSPGEYACLETELAWRGFLACARALEPKWVDVADQDPPEAKSVLVSGFEYGNPKYARTYGVAFYAEGVWVSDETGERIHTPTHWMPLPEKPNAAMSAALEEKR